MPTHSSQSALQMLRVPGSQESFVSLVDEVWDHRQDLDLQPSHTMVYRLSGLEAPLESGLDPARFYQDLAAEVARLPPTVEAGTGSVGATKSDLLKALRAAADGSAEPGQEAKLRWGKVRLNRKQLDPEARRDRVFLNTKPKAAIQWAQWLAHEVLAKPKEFPGVDLVEVTGPGATTRPDDVMVLTSSAEGRERLLQWIRSKADSHPETLEPEIISGAEGVRPGVSWGNEPDPIRYPGESFRSLRARVLYNVVRESQLHGEDRAGFERRLRTGLFEAGIDPSRPHLELDHSVGPAVKARPLEGAVPMEPGEHTVRFEGFDGPVTATIVIDETMSRHLKRQKNLAFLPNEGLFVKTFVDRTRDPPTTTVRSEFPLTYAADQRYKIEFGERPPKLIEYDPTTERYHVPARVILEPGPPGRLFQARTEGVASEPKRSSEPMQHLMARFIDGEDGPARVAAQRMEKLLGDPQAQVVSVVPLEEGVNGKAIVKLSNGALALWKPSAAEFPELMRARVDPDHYARREAFAYEVSKALGHAGRVPPAVYRELGGRPGALIALVRNSEPGMFSHELEPLLKDPKRDDYQEIALLDHVLGSLDRHYGNVLFARGRALAIDHGVCFPRQHGDQGFHHFLFDHPVELNAHHRARLTELQSARPGLEAKAKELGIDPGAVKLMFDRAEDALRTGRLEGAWRKAS